MKLHTYYSQAHTRLFWESGKNSKLKCDAYLLVGGCGCVFGHSLVSYSLQPHGLQPGNLICLWDFPGKNAGVACHFLLQGNPPDPGIKPVSLASPALVGRLSHWGSTMLNHKTLNHSHLKSRARQKMPPSLPAFQTPFMTHCLHSQASEILW